MADYTSALQLAPKFTDAYVTAARHGSLWRILMERSLTTVRRSR